MLRFTFLHIFFCLIFSTSSCFSLETNLTDYAVLMAFKSHLVLKPDDLLSTNWTSTTHFCNWFGVSCLNQRVTNLKLPGLGLKGRISSDIANMTRLIVLDLSGNALGGSLPEELGFLQRLRILNVTNNSIQGRIPHNLSQCQMLQELDLSYNFIAGTIPEDLGLLVNLNTLALDHNNLTGNIPASLGNFTKLQELYLHLNDLVGEIPAELGNLSSLTLLALRDNNLTGPIPPSIFNVSTLQKVDMSMNSLSGKLPVHLGDRLPNIEWLLLDRNRITGEIPVSLCNASKLTRLYFTRNDLRGNMPNEFGRLHNLAWLVFEYNQISGSLPGGLFNISSLVSLRTRHNYLSGHLPDDLGNWLPNLQEIFLSHNQFSGQIPSSICNATKLTALEVSNNSFSGPVPMMLGKLKDLVYLDLQINMLVNNPQFTHLDFLNSLVNCRKLNYLIFDANPLNGILPNSVGNLSSNLKVFTAMSSQLQGGIPYELGNLSSLIYLGLSDNDLQGEIPSSVSRLQKLERLYLADNTLEGTLPAEICSIKALGILDLGENGFSGSIPLYIQNLTELRELSLASNNFSSPIPLVFWDLVKIQHLNLSRNLLHGSIPTEVGNLKTVDIMDISSNRFSGEIPSSIGYLQNLFTLDMSKNDFQGQIPDTLSNLVVIEFIDLSSNYLSGTIPASLGSLQDLQYLNLSFNRLQGEVPNTGVFKNMTNEYLMGNPNLCGAPNLKLPLCSVPASGRTSGRTSLILKITIPIAATVLLAITYLLIWISLSRKRNEKNATKTSYSPQIGYRVISYREILQATENFNVSNLVGEGSSGLVYMGRLSDGIFVAIKVFNMEYMRALQNFEAECEVLRNVRHRNLVKIISTCSNEEFKAMVLEFMPNGSLDKWLYSQSHSPNLVERLDILIDVAQAMEYLHHEYTVPIVHCDLKPSNVLFDEDMNGHVADFGIAKILGADQKSIQTKTLGTIGYIAPEYGLDGQVSTKVDVYSFGILLLETFTGKKPTADIFKEDLSLHQWVNKSFPNALVEVIDSNLFRDVNFVKESSSFPINKEQKQIEELIVSIIDVGLLCSKEVAEQRIDMRDAVVQLKKIRAGLKKSYGNR